MDEIIEIIPVEIPRARYEEHMTNLVKALLEIDEKLNPSESTRTSHESEAA